MLPKDKAKDAAGNLLRANSYKKLEEARKPAGEAQPAEIAEATSLGELGGTREGSIFEAECSSSEMLVGGHISLTRGAVWIDESGTPRREGYSTIQLDTGANIRAITSPELLASARGDRVALNDGRRGASRRASRVEGRLSRCELALA